MTPDSFSLVMLQGHLEAGQIEFQVRDGGKSGRLVFEIESWARSGDRLSLLLHQSLRMAKEVQLHMWTSFLERVRNYEFADPRVIRAVYHPEQPLEERDMLLEARFCGLRFRFGVRVGGVHDEVREVDGRRVQVWGWNYRTLQGHLGMGQMDYDVRKWLGNGQVESRTCRFSRHAHVADPIVRLGLRLFGHREQVRFAQEACRRMARLTAEPDRSGAAHDLPRVGDTIEVRSG